MKIRTKKEIINKHDHNRENTYNTLEIMLKNLNNHKSKHNCKTCQYGNTSHEIFGKIELFKVQKFSQP